MTHPYADLPSRAFWRSAVAETPALDLQDIYRPRFPIPQDLPIAAAGSCFAQHIGRQFKQRGYRFLDVEPPPPLVSEDVRHAYGYDLYSARYGNIYTIRQMRQLLERAVGTFDPVEQVWETDGRFHDPFRPTIEPTGFDSPEIVLASARAHLAAVRRLMGEARLLVFTFGLTEGWLHRQDGTAFPTCPGTVAGEFDESRHEFHNFTVAEVMADAEAVIALLRDQVPDMRFLFTVSPVPLTATASGDHVLPATTYSKSVLRAVCGELRERHEFVDYFPSYELVSSHPMRAMFFAPNLRSVVAPGVQHVMEHFFAAHHGPELPADGRPGRDERPEVPAATEDDVVCEEGLLEAFAQ